MTMPVGGVLAVRAAGTSGYLSAVGARRKGRQVGGDQQLGGRPPAEQSAALRINASARAVPPCWK